MFINHIAVFLENKKGRLHDFCKVLSDAGINQVTTTISDTKDYGILRAITSDNDKALKVLKEAGFTASSIDLVAVAVEDEAGGLSALLSVLSSFDVQIEYMYSYKGKNNKGLIVLKLSDNEQGIKVIKDNGFSLVGKEVF